MTGKYFMVLSEGSIPSSAVGTEFDHSDIHGSRTIRYFRVYMPDLDQIREAPLPEPTTLYGKDRIREIDRQFNSSQKTKFLPYERDLI